MNRRSLLTVIVALFALASLIVGCGGGGSSADKTKFCQDNATLDKIAGSVSSPAEAVQVLKSKQSTIDDFSKTAPSDVKTDAQALVTAANAAIKANSIDGLTAPAIQTVGQRVDAFCGQDAGGNPIGNTSASSYSLSS